MTGRCQCMTERFYSWVDVYIQGRICALYHWIEMQLKCSQSEALQTPYALSHVNSLSILIELTQVILSILELQKLLYVFCINTELPDRLCTSSFITREQSLEEHAALSLTSPGTAWTFHIYTASVKHGISITCLNSKIKSVLKIWQSSKNITSAFLSDCARSSTPVCFG